eukprot:4190147-Lingulodinium_polyedra.AAC.1
MHHSLERTLDGRRPQSNGNLADCRYPFFRVVALAEGPRQLFRQCFVNVLDSCLPFCAFVLAFAVSL